MSVPRRKQKAQHKHAGEAGDPVSEFRGALRHALNSQPAIAAQNRHYQVLNEMNVEARGVARALSISSSVVERAFNYLEGIDQSARELAQLGREREVENFVSRTRVGLRKHVMLHQLIPMH